MKNPPLPLRIGGQWLAVQLHPSQLWWSVTDGNNNSQYWFAMAGCNNEPSPPPCTGGLWLTVTISPPTSVEGQWLAGTITPQHGAQWLAVKITPQALVISGCQKQYPPFSIGGQWLEAIINPSLSRVLVVFDCNNYPPPSIGGQWLVGGVSEKFP